MKFRCTIILTILLSSFNSIGLYAQNTDTTKNSLNKEYLKGLTKVGGRDWSSNDLRFAKEGIINYNIDGKIIKENEMKQALTSGNYMSDHYMDNKKVIKAVVLRMATEDEKKRKKEREAPSELIGKDASIFTAFDINGNEYSLNNLKGKIIVMNFWYVECKPCVREMPELNILVEKYKNKDVVFLGFATNDKSKIDSFLKKNIFSYNIIPNSKKIAAEYKVLAYPTHLIIDKNSKIVFSTIGFGSRTITDIEKTIESLIKE